LVPDRVTQPDQFDTFRFVVADPTGFPGNDVGFGPNEQIVRIDNPFINVGTLSTRRIDFGGAYITKEYPWGKLDFEVNATYVYGYSVKTSYPHY
jgi:hypothetical protein